MGIAPALTEETDAFWAAAADGRLVVEQCPACGAASHPPRGMCRACRNRTMTPLDLTGSAGTVYSHTVNHQRWLPDLEVPFAIVLVEFPRHPGVRVAGRYVGEGEPRIGQQVIAGADDGVPSFDAAG